MSELPRPRVSVIVPAYNCEPYLEATLRSLVEQTEPDLEIVVVDDGSTDATLEIARRAAGKDKRIVVISQRNSGTPSTPRNAGIRASRGEYITFLDADDLYHPDKLRVQLGAFESMPDLDLVFADVVWFSGDRPDPEARGFLDIGNYLQQADSYLEQHADTLYRCRPSFYSFMSTRHTSVTTQTVMIRRAALLRQATWFREDWRVGEDIDLWFRLVKESQAGFVNQTLAYYRQRPGSLMTEAEQSVRGAIQAHAANLERARSVLSAQEVQALTRRVARHHRTLAYLLRERGQPRLARQSYRAARGFSAGEFSALDYAKTFIPAALRKLLRARRRQP